MGGRADPRITDNGPANTDETQNLSHAGDSHVSPAHSTIWEMERGLRRQAPSEAFRFRRISPEEGMRRGWPRLCRADLQDTNVGDLNLSSRQGGPRPAVVELPEVILHLPGPLQIGTLGPPRQVCPCEPIRRHLLARMANLTDFHLVKIGATAFRLAERNQ
jgi:hypothetical protein